MEVVAEEKQTFSQCLASKSVSCDKSQIIICHQISHTCTTNHTISIFLWLQLSNNIWTKKKNITLFWCIWMDVDAVAMVSCAIVVEINAYGFDDLKWALVFHWERDRAKERAGNVKTEKKMQNITCTFFGWFYFLFKYDCFIWGFFFVCVWWMVSIMHDGV